MSLYRFERLNGNNLKDLIVLYADSFGAQVDLDYLRKKYDTHYTGHVFTGFLAYDQTGFPAAYYGMFPALFTIDGRTVLCAQSGDTMTHSLHRKKGLFVDLAKETFRLGKELGMEFVFGFPNSNSFPGFMKLGWKHDHDLNMYRVRISTLPLARAAKKYKRLFGAMYEKWLQFRLKKYAGAGTPGNSAAGEGRLTQIHDSNFFGYKKYFTKFIVSTGLADWYIRFDGRLFIGDFQLKPGADFNTEFGKLKKIARRCGADELEIQCSPGTMADHLFATVAPEKMKGISACYLSFTEQAEIKGFSFVLADADTF